MQYKPIKICHAKNAILGKDFNLGMIGFFFHAFTPRSRTYLFNHDLKHAYVYSHLMCASNFAMPPSHNIKGSYPTFELLIETL
jgi:hypothetical protein